MMTSKQSSDINISRVYTTLIGGAVVTSILVLGNDSIAINCNGDNSRQIVCYNDEETNIYQSFTSNYGITFNVPGYSSTKSIDSGIEKVIISEEKLENLKKLEAIALLKDNWNENGARAFSIELITKVRNIITFLDVQPEVFPTACDSIQLEYDKVDGSHMEIELMEKGDAEIFLIDNMGNEKFFNVQACFESINKAVNVFYG